MTPFVTPDVRKKIQEEGVGVAEAVGDLCYIVYAEIMKRWGAEPRWTTIHYIRKDFVTTPKTSEFLNHTAELLKIAGKFSETEDGRILTGVKFDRADLETAAALAFDVFMHFHGIEYEKKKREENGDIF